MKEKANKQKLSTESVNDQCLRIIENQVNKKFSNPEQVNFCNCNICANKYELKQKGKAFMRQASSLLKLDSSKIQTFLNLLTPVNENIFLKMQIPDIVFFQKGYPKVFYRSKNTGITSKNMENYGIKNIVNLFVDRKRHIYSNSKQAISNGYNGNHIKFFQTIIPSYKHQQQKNLSRTFVFHNNDKIQENGVMQLSRSSFQEICIIKYKQKGFQLLNEKQLRAVLKPDGNLTSIDFISTYIKPKQRQESFFFSDYQRYQLLQNKLMFDRALAQVKTQINLTSRFSKEYIPLQQLQEYESVLKQMPREYVLYQSYKIIHYMEIVKDIKVSKLNVVWIKDENGQVCFFGLLAFEYQENEKLTVDIDLAEIREIKQTQMTDLQKELMNAWEKMKKRKFHYQQPVQVDQKMQEQIQIIKNESSIRKNKVNSTPRHRLTPTKDRSTPVPKRDGSRKPSFNT